MHTAENSSAGRRGLLADGPRDRSASAVPSPNGQEHGLDAELLRRTATWAGVLLAAVAIAWAITADQMTGMDGGPATDLGAFGWFVGVWAVMMAAMMLPPASPMILTYARSLTARRSAAAAVGPTFVFALAYLLVWVAVGVVAYAAVELVRSLSPGFLAWGQAGQYVAGGVIVAAAVYQLTRAKDCCLGKCRSTLEFAPQSGRDTYRHAVQMGVKHGAWCVGCCWALFVALFALGVMSIFWMVVVAAIIAAERLLPWKPLARSAAAVLLLVLGLGVAFAPGSVPNFTDPGEASGMQMKMEGHGAPGSMKMQGGGSMKMHGGSGSMKPMPPGAGMGDGH